MSIALIGGMDRLERQYKNEAEKMGINLKIFTRSKAGIASKIRYMDVLVIFTNKISHRAKREAMNVAKAQNTPVFLYHSCGVCTLRDCFRCLKK